MLEMGRINLQIDATEDLIKLFKTRLKHEVVIGITLIILLGCVFFLVFTKESHYLALDIFSAGLITVNIIGVSRNLFSLSAKLLKQQKTLLELKRKKQDLIIANNLIPLKRNL